MKPKSNTTIGKTTFYLNIGLFMICLLTLIGLREYGIQTLQENGDFTYDSHTYLRLTANILIIILALAFMKINKLFTWAGWGFGKIEKGYLLIFPLLYLPLINYLFMDDVDTKVLFPHILLLLGYCISIGFSEELALRAVLQSYIIKYLKKDKKRVLYGVFGAAFFFAILHLIKFDKGVYGEMAQLLFAFFIGSMFGMLLLVTKRLYPLIVIHAIIDFVAKLDNAGIPIDGNGAEPTSLISALASVVLTLPCMLYAWFLYKKYKAMPSGN
ncbi:CPBP family intramembrane glutamic endopeptidase [Spongiimicrobium salis]|uniref:CPBP family intramembrane glutamic endopeptidase n=1 Tax=Spongiimicrobium salis TaxID=1667022 RepID=UPI00374D25A2